MFTGIVKAIGTVLSKQPVPGGELLDLTTDLALLPGDSLAVHGCCLTVAETDGARIRFHLSEETLARTTLAGLTAGDRVNLEPPLTLGAPLGGHLVLGHVDAVATVAEVTPHGTGRVLRLAVPEHLLRYLPEKGSLAVDGVSLTIAERSGDGTVAIALIPYTLAATTLGDLTPGSRVNIEIDPIARYLEALLEDGPWPSLAKRGEVPLGGASEAHDSSRSAPRC